MAKEKKQSPPKFVYNCVRCGQYCSKVTEVNVHFNDINRWRKNGMLPSISQNIGMSMNGGFPQLVLESKDLKFIGQNIK